MRLKGCSKRSLEGVWVKSPPAKGQDLSIRYPLPFHTREPGGMQHVEYSVGWITLALINAGLAQSKNRRGWVWFLLSLFVGPIATFLIVIWSKD